MAPKPKPPSEIQPLPVTVGILEMRGGATERPNAKSIPKIKPLPVEDVGILEMRGGASPRPKPKPDSGSSPKR